MDKKLHVSRKKISDIALIKKRIKSVSEIYHLLTPEEKETLKSLKDKVIKEYQL